MSVLRLCLVILCAPAVANSAPCADLAGDADLVASVGQLLEARGVRCAGVHARVERDGAGIIVRNDTTIPTIRSVGDAATAATVIESWAQDDVVDPLLASRPVEAPRDVATVAAAVVVPPAAPAPSFQGVQLFAAAESSIANDKTGWIGVEAGACVMVGPICAAAWLRSASVKTGPDWTATLDRHNTELMIGADIPFKLGRGMFAPGFGGGIGAMHTQVAGETSAGTTGGLRADVHAALSYPLSATLALDVSLAVELTQATHQEVDSPMDAPSFTIPEEPLWLVRLGLGIRYGRL